MRIPVRLKLIIVLAAFVVFGLAVIGILYRALTDVRTEVDKLARHHQPMAIAAHKIEVDVNGIGLAVLAYVETARPDYRTWVTHDRQDIAELLGGYAALADTESERRLAVEMDRLLGVFTTRAEALLNKSDALNAVRAELAECVEEFDRMLVDWVRGSKELKPPGDTESTRAALAMAAELTEISLALGWNPPFSQHTRQTRFTEQIAALKLHGERFARIRLGTEEHRAATRIINEHLRVAELIEHTITLEDQADVMREQFIEARADIDHLLADKVQTLAHSGFEMPLRAIDGLTRQASHQLGFVVLPLFAVCTLVVGLLMVRGVTLPLSALKKGIRTVARGDTVLPIQDMPNDEFGDLATEFNKMARQLHERGTELATKDAELRRRETMACMGTLVSGVAHEVRNPLFGITSTLDALQARLHGQPEFGRHIGVLRGETARLKKLMQDLLDYGRPAPHVRAVTDLHRLVEAAAASCAPLADERGVAISRELHAPPPWLALDGLRMEQVLVNLIENALQHSARGSTVTITTHGEDHAQHEAIVVTVRDQGQGFQADELHRVFEPFFTRRRGGTGLGLSIVQRVVEEHGGTVTASNHPHGGAVMTLMLPAPQAAAQDIAALTEQPGPALADRLAAASTSVSVAGAGSMVDATSLPGQADRGTAEAGTPLRA